MVIKAGAEPCNGNKLLETEWSGIEFKKDVAVYL